MSGFIRLVENLCRYLYWVAGASLASMMFLTVADVVLRLFKRPILGTYELVGFLGALTIGFAIPQTSLDRGHVLMDFLTERLKGLGGRALYVATRLLGVGLFAIIAWNLFLMGNDLLDKSEVSLTLHLPQYPLAYGIAFCCLVQCLVLITDLARKEAA
ncbi:MAG: TRAP transporter small permease [Desulfarculus sp.]|nr:TRAP transporter small permease [Desulfarculus sp.]